MQIPDGLIERSRHDGQDQPSAPSFSRRLSLRRNFAWTFSGNMVYAATQWGLVAVLAKLSGPEAVGHLALAFAVCKPIFMFSDLHLRVVVATDTGYAHPFADYAGLRIASLFVALLLLAVVMLVAGFGVVLVGVIMILGLAKVFESISDIVYGQFQRSERMDYIGKAMMSKGLLSVTAFGVIYWATGSLILAVAQ